MEKRYYLHRISHENETSYSLLEKGFLTLGWEIFTDSGILDAAREDGYPQFGIIAGKYGEDRNRSRWNIWYFARMYIGDIVVVPLYGGLFSVYEVRELAEPITALERVLSSVQGYWNRHRISWKEHRLFDEAENRKVDLGFFVKAEPIVINVPRKIVDGTLISRMKIRTTNADITDIEASVDSAIKAGKENKPITLYESTIDTLASQLQKSIQKNLDDIKFEHLIKWYLERCGANTVWIPPKNERGKEDGADADVIADFMHLNYMVYVQAKHHNNARETSEWAVHQIVSYKEQKRGDDPSYTYATWAITSGDAFSDRAIKEAAENHVRLITGKEFSQMLLNIGLLDLNDAFAK